MLAVLKWCGQRSALSVLQAKVAAIVIEVVWAILCTWGDGWLLSKSMSTVRYILLSCKDSCS